MEIIRFWEHPYDRKQIDWSIQNTYNDGIFTETDSAKTDDVKYFSHSNYFRSFSGIESKTVDNVDEDTKDVHHNEFSTMKKKIEVWKY